MRFVLFLLLAQFAAAVQAQEVAEWEEKLTAENFAAREAATRELWQKAVAEPDLLPRLQQSVHPEVNARARHVQRIIDLQRHPGEDPGVLEELEGIVTQLNLKEQKELLVEWLNRDDTRTGYATTLLAVAALDGRETQSELGEIAVDIGWSLVDAPGQREFILAGHYHPESATFLLETWSRMQHPTIQDFCHDFLKRTARDEVLMRLSARGESAIGDLIILEARDSLLTSPAEAAKILIAALRGNPSSRLLLRHLAALKDTYPDLLLPQDLPAISRQGLALLAARLSGGEGEIRRQLAAVDSIDPLALESLIFLGEWQQLLDLPSNSLGTTPAINHNVRHFLAHLQHGHTQHTELGKLAHSTARRNPANSLAHTIAVHDRSGAVSFAGQLRNLEDQFTLLLNAGKHAAAIDLRKKGRRDSRTANRTLLAYLAARYPAPDAASLAEIGKEFLTDFRPSNGSERTLLLKLYWQWQLDEKIVRLIDHENYNDKEAADLLELVFPGKGWINLLFHHISKDPGASTAEKTRLLLSHLRGKESPESTLRLLRIAASLSADDTAATLVIKKLLQTRDFETEDLRALLAGTNFLRFTAPSLITLCETYGATCGEILRRDWQRRLDYRPHWVIGHVGLAHCDPDNAEEHIRRAEALALGNVADLTTVLNYHRNQLDSENARRISEKILALSSRAAPQSVIASNYLGSLAFRNADYPKAAHYFSRHQLGTLLSSQTYSSVTSYTQTSATLAEALGLTALAKDDLTAAIHWHNEATDLHLERITLAEAIYDALPKGQKRRDFASKVEAQLADAAQNLPELVHFALALEKWRAITR